MKKSFLFFSLFTIISILTISCSKSDNSTPTPTPDQQNPSTALFIKYTYNSVQYQHESETINSLKKTILGYSGINDALKKMTLYIPLTPTVGSHNVTDAPSNVDAYSANFQSGSDFSLDGKSGTINITVSTSTTIEGTFEFSGLVNGVAYSVSGGSFRASK